MNDGAETPSSLVQSGCVGQFNRRRLWGRHDAVDDGFMGLVSCVSTSFVKSLMYLDTVFIAMGKDFKAPSARCARP